MAHCFQGFENQESIMEKRIDEYICICAFDDALKLFLVFCYQNFFELLWEKIVPVIEKNLKFKAEGREFSIFWTY